MIRIVFGLLDVVLCGCGGGDPCEGVDTSQAADSSTVSGNNITYTGAAAPERISSSDDVLRLLVLRSLGILA